MNHSILDRDDYVPEVDIAISGYCTTCHHWNRYLTPIKSIDGGSDDYQLCPGCLLEWGGRATIVEGEPRANGTHR